MKKRVNVIFIGLDLDDCIVAANGIYHAIGDDHWGLCDYLISGYISRSKGEFAIAGESSGNVVAFRSVQCDAAALKRAYEAIRSREASINYDKVLNALGLSRNDLRKRTIFVDLTADPEINALIEVVLGLYKELSAPFAVLHGANNGFVGLVLACMKGQPSAKIALDYRIEQAELESEKEFRPIAENFFSCNEEDPWLEPVGHLLLTASALLCV